MDTLKGLYRLSHKERQDVIMTQHSKKQSLQQQQLTAEIADAMIENFVDFYRLPLGIAPNFMIDGILYHIPMVIEEPSVIAAASNGAKYLGNIETSSTARELIGQIVFANVKDVAQSVQLIKEQHAMLLEKARAFSHSMVKRGGGPTRIWTEYHGEYLTCYIGFNPCDAMGANAINQLLEYLSPFIEQIIDVPALMRILSNYQPNAVVTARCKIATEQLDVAQQIVSAAEYAKLDVYRATTHNKGILNGIDAVLIATGNDWRAVEAGVHAYTSRSGHYQPLTNWWIEDNYLIGEISLPLAVATVGGTVSVHPTAQWSLALLGSPDADTLARIMAAVGLAQNFAALRAIVSEGIQKGHMALHARQLCVQVGASEEEAIILIDLLKGAPKMSEAVAKQLLAELRNKQ